MTAVQWLIKKITKEKTLTESYDIFYLALEMEREQRLKMLIDFQVYLNQDDYISDVDWDWEHMAIKFLNSCLVCTCKNAELEKDSLVPVYCHNCNAYVQTNKHYD